MVTMIQRCAAAAVVAGGATTAPLFSADTSAAASAPGMPSASTACLAAGDGALASSDSSASTTVLPTTRILPAHTPDASSVSAANCVGARCSVASAVMAVRCTSSGNGSSGRCVRRPASTCTTGMPAMNAAVAAIVAVMVSPCTTTAVGRSCVSAQPTCSISRAPSALSSWLSRISFISMSGWMSSADMAVSSRESCWPVAMTITRQPSAAVLRSAATTGASLMASGRVPKMTATVLDGGGGAAGAAGAASASGATPASLKAALVEERPAAPPRDAPTGMAATAGLK